MSERFIPLVDLSAAHGELGDRLEAAVLGVIRSQRFIGGPELASFEDAFCSCVGAKHAIGVSNGTAALELGLQAFGIGRGDEVLVPGNTFIATAEAVSATGAEPVFVDVERDSGLIDLESAAAHLSPATAAILPVHLYGRMVEMEAVVDFAESAGLGVVEDAAQAHGARRSGRAAGTVGTVASWSFYPGKNLGAFGDAGAITTSDDELAEQARLLRDHGREGRDRHVVIGGNHRMDALQAAVLSVKLELLGEWNQRRRRIAMQYRELLPEQVLDWRAPEPDAEVHHLFPILVDERDAVAEALAVRGVGTGVHYRAALPRTEAYAGARGAAPVAEWRAERQLSLPMHPHLKEAQVARVAEAVRAAVESRPV